jgi:hypothetical protein
MQHLIEMVLQFQPLTTGGSKASYSENLKFICLASSTHDIELPVPGSKHLSQKIFHGHETSQPFLMKLKATSSKNPRNVTLAEMCTFK